MCRLPVVLCAVALLACSSGPTPESGARASGPRPEAEGEFPALRYVPRDAALVVVTARLGDAATVAREVAMPLLIGLNLDDNALGQWIAAAVGVDLMTPEGLRAVGLDANSGAAAFAHGGGLVVVASIADEAALRAVLEQQRSRAEVSVSSHGDHEVTTTQAPGEPKMSWAVVDGWLVLRTGGGGAGASWLEPILAASAGESFAATKLFAGARRRARAQLGDATPGVILAARPPALARQHADLLPPDFAPCAAAVAAIAPRAFGYASAGWEQGIGGIELALAGGAVASLREAVGPSPGAGLIGLRESHGVSASLALSVQWVHEIRQASGCPGLSRPIDDPAAAVGWRPPPSGYHLVLSALDLDRMEGDGAALLTIRDRRFIDRQLGSIPGRSLFDRKKTVGGVAVRRVNIPGYDPVFYRISDSRLEIASNKDRMAALVSDASGPEGSSREIAFLRLVPARIERLGELMSDLYARAGYRSTVGATRQAQRLARYEWAQLALELDGKTLRLRADMKLRP